MRKISITEKCNHCGICVVKCPEYFSETDDGDVCLTVTNVNETTELKNAIEACPIKAIQLGEEIDSKQNIMDYMNLLEKMRDGLSVKKEDIEFHEGYCMPVDVPHAGISGYDYKSSSQAERAGYDAFVRRSYSQIDNLILERITLYRINVIKPYYTTDSDSVYAKNNKKISDILKAISVTISNTKVSSDFCNVDVFPDTNNVVWKMLNRGEVISNNFIGKVKSEFSYGASEYKVYIDYDDTEDYRGKDMYCYKAGEASTELGKDLGNALKWAKGSIESGALDYVKCLIDMYNRNLNNFLDQKIAELKSLGL
mgnify:FL=1